MYEEDDYVGITFFALLSNPLAIATKKNLLFTTCITGALVIFIVDGRWVSFTIADSLVVVGEFS
jgi:hypothetical protein